ncbi:hypothetical protein [Couchioplanes azureus]|uniref:hypothetical protein n=1 Tax=Couchioplanes caeruleus TaxID=56438 RepID=UPI00166FAB1B|nr:hypothetical protein [Couchioplanes caeruleus]GGQ41223.1 hypothetical protein GCM10010166_05750 [Couchioplanes caeruleus subsp. azureus]
MEDNGPASTFTAGFTSIETDIRAMEEFAAALAEEVQSGYDPLLQQITAAMVTELPAGSPAFPELQSFMQHHYDAQLQTFSNTFNFRDGTHQFATVARSISEEYGNSDAYARANVKDVTDGFTDANDPFLDGQAIGGTSDADR